MIGHALNKQVLIQNFSARMQPWVGCLRVVKSISLNIFPPCFGKYLQPSMYGGIVHSKTLTWLINDQIVFTTPCMYEY